ncbi:MAG: hypothetical protein KDE08_14270 [Rhodobacteraceae bacterium]|nr:hypothetical protein [Paracoccaceae bacterium]
MDYHQTTTHSYHLDNRRLLQNDRQGGAGSTIFLVGFLLAAVLLVVWLAGSGADGESASLPAALGEQTATAATN